MFSPASLALLILLAFTSPARFFIAQDTAQATRPALTLTDCEVPGVKGKARCGSYEVFENRATRQGRKIKLRIVVLPATGADRAPDPYFYLAGGPGVSSVESAAGVAQMVEPIRARRDLVFLDQRGTGGSNPLLCPLYAPSDLQSSLREFFPPESVRRCRIELEAKADLMLYTTNLAADDLDEVRAALGYEQINLFGASYGTRAALVYLKRHPRSVRTLTLQGVAPTNKYMPLDFPQSAERALDGVLGECERDATCRTAFPRIRTEAREVFERLKKSPVEVEIMHPRTGALARVRLSRNLAAEAVRYMLYGSGSSPRIPLFIHRAAAGDFAPLAEAALSFRQNLVDADSNGLYLSITCAEDLPFIKPGEGERVDDTFLGSYRLVEQRAACALWPRAQIPSDYSAPTRSDVPVLILTGQWDPVTPPSNGDEVARSLPNNLHVVVPQGGHGFGGLEGGDCIRRLMSEFVERGTTKGIDTSCVSGIRRRGFQTVAPELKLVALAETELAKFAGRYVGETDPSEFSAEVAGDRLKFTLQNGRVFLLAPVSPHKFRVVGAPGLYVTFEMTEGRVRRVVGHEGDAQVFSFIPKKP